LHRSIPWLLTCLLACSGGDGAPAHATADTASTTATGPSCTGSQTNLELVLGETVDGAFVTLEPGDEPELVYGPQGGHHLELALRVDGLGEGPLEPLLTMAAEIEESDGPRSVGHWLRGLHDPRPTLEGEATWLDLRLVVEAWSTDRPRRLFASVEDDLCGSEGSVELLLPAL
jgi:hypothetical protein